MSGPTSIIAPDGGIPVSHKSPEEIAGELYSETSKSLRSGSHGMQMLALHIPYALGNNPNKYIAWRKRVLPPDGKVVELTRFEDYLLKPVREGLGLPSLRFINGAMKLMGKDGEPALAALRQEIPNWDERIERESANDLASQRKTIKRGRPSLSDNTNNVSVKSDGVRRTQHGNSRAYTLSRLDRERPDLFELVVQGEMSANAAAIEAGWRKRLTRVDRAMMEVQRMTPDEYREFIRRLANGHDSTEAQS